MIIIISFIITIIVVVISVYIYPYWSKYLLKKCWGFDSGG